MWRWWVIGGLCAAAAVHLAGGSTVLAVAAGALSPALPAFLAGVLRGARTPAPAAADAMSGGAFEEHVARAARAAGLPIIMTGRTGDWGVDLVVGRRPDRVAVQCKRVSRPVGSAAVQEVVAGAAMHDCAHTMVVTNNVFTPAARALADRHGCVLVTGADLPRLGRLIRALATR